MSKNKDFGAFIESFILSNPADGLKRLTNIVKKYNNLNISCEIFPLKKLNRNNKLWENIDNIIAQDIEFISVTYGANGSSQFRSFENIDYLIQRDANIPLVAHLTLVNSTKNSLDICLDSLAKRNIKGIMALRGDINSSSVLDHKLKSSLDLIDFIHSNYPKFKIFVSAYPESYKNNNVQDNIDFLKRKFEKGAYKAVSQFFF